MREVGCVVVEERRECRNDLCGRRRLHLDHATFTLLNLLKLRWWDGIGIEVVGGGGKRYLGFGFATNLSSSRSKSMSMSMSLSLAISLSLATPKSI